MRIRIWIFYCLLLTSVLLSSCKLSNSDNDNEGKVYYSLNEYIPYQFEIEDRIDLSIDGDSIDDFIYVIRVNKSNQRHLLVCFGMPDNGFKVMADATKAILSVDESGYETDPFVKIESKTNGFSISHVSKLQPECLYVHEFMYTASTRKFFLNKVIYEECSMEGSVGLVKNPTDFGQVSLEDFIVNKKY